MDRGVASHQARQATAWGPRSVVTAYLLFFSGTEQNEKIKEEEETKNSGEFNK